MPEEWTGDLIGRMHNEHVTADELASELGYCKGYVSMILNGSRSPKGCREKFVKAFEEILKRRTEAENN